MSLINTDSYTRDCGGENTLVFFYGETRNKQFNGFSDIVYMSGKIILSILSHFSESSQIPIDQAGTQLFLLMRKRIRRWSNLSKVDEEVCLHLSIATHCFRVASSVFVSASCLPTPLDCLSLVPFKDSLSQAASHPWVLGRATGHLDFTGRLLLLHQKLCLDRKWEFHVLVFLWQAGWSGILLLDSWCLSACIPSMWRSLYAGLWGESLTDAVGLPRCACSLLVFLPCVESPLRPSRGSGASAPWQHQICCTCTTKNMRAFVGLPKIRKVPWIRFITPLLKVFWNF